MFDSYPLPVKTINHFLCIEGVLTWGGGQTMQCSDDMLWNCVPETCRILLTRVTPTSLIKRKKE